MRTTDDPDIIVGVDSYFSSKKLKIKMAERVIILRLKLLYRPYRKSMGRCYYENFRRCFE
jgi:hypothetical protein